jgi:(2Fe-2S) ferredoxin
MKKQPVPDWVHVFVCVNDRHKEKPSCADKDAVEIYARLKAAVKASGRAGRSVRVSKSGCLGLCAAGPNVVLYPEKIHFAHVTLDDLPEIEAAVEQAAAEHDRAL